MSTIVISEREFASLRDSIRDRLGIYYDDTKLFLLQSRLQTRLIKNRCESFAAYHRFLAASLQRDKEWDELASVLSNNETYFFRERAQLEVLASEAVDEALRSSGRLRIWSSGCSTGEEPYTIAMVLLDSKRLNPSAVTIRASDISPAALERAKAGFYRELAFRATAPEMVRRHFTPFESGFVVSDEVKRMVVFFRMNLVETAAFAGFGVHDAIFCRNVLIYFDKPTQKRVVEAFAGSLRPGGFLFLGHAESIARLTDLYEPFVTSKAIYYRRRP
ncbi:MAG: protein-glutamate O-methyltransferase CheR [Candidatus Eremiobacteraeota bacterium]|nr:protein-glutamate O-methyltransferase CheR [Candidatus Eremiobacteraeota bacterium]